MIYAKETSTKFPRNTLLEYEKQTNADLYDMPECSPVTTISSLKYWRSYSFLLSTCT